MTSHKSKFQDTLNDINDKIYRVIKDTVNERDKAVIDAELSDIVKSIDDYITAEVERRHEKCMRECTGFCERVEEALDELNMLTTAMKAEFLKNSYIMNAFLQHMDKIMEIQELEVSNKNSKISENQMEEVNYDADLSTENTGGDPNIVDAETSVAVELPSSVQDSPIEVSTDESKDLSELTNEPLASLDLSTDLMQKNDIEKNNAQTPRKID